MTSPAAVNILVVGNWSLKPPHIVLFYTAGSGNRPGPVRYRWPMSWTRPPGFACYAALRVAAKPHCSMAWPENSATFHMPDSSRRKSGNKGSGRASRGVVSMAVRVSWRIGGFIQDAVSVHMEWILPPSNVKLWPHYPPLPGPAFLSLMKSARWNCFPRGSSLFWTG